jgi:hypothetical protein
MQPAFRKRIGKQVHAATNYHATIQLLLETVISTRTVQRVIRKIIGTTQSVDS